MLSPYRYVTDGDRLTFNLDRSTRQVITDVPPFGNSKSVNSISPFSSDEDFAHDQTFQCNCGEILLSFTAFVGHRRQRHLNHHLPVFWSAVINSQAEAVSFVKKLFEMQQKTFHRVANTGIKLGQIDGTVGWQCDGYYPCPAFVILRKMPGNKFGVLYSRSHSVNCVAPIGTTSLSIDFVAKSTAVTNGEPPSKRTRVGTGEQGTSAGSGSDSQLPESAVTKEIVVPISTLLVDPPSVGTVGYFKMKADAYQVEFDALAIRRSEAFRKLDSLQREVAVVEASFASVPVGKEKNTTIEKSADAAKKEAEQQQRLTICLVALQSNVARVTALISDTKVMMVDVKEQRNRMRNEEDWMKQNL